MEDYREVPAAELRQDIIPLNSKRLKSAYVKQLAEALEVPTSAFVDEIRLMIEAKVEETGHSASNVQVMSRDASGLFLDAPHSLTIGDDREALRSGQPTVTQNHTKERK